jgi:iron(III) transport system substrate-binding protein
LRIIIINFTASSTVNFFVRSQKMGSFRLGSRFGWLLAGMPLWLSGCDGSQQPAAADAPAAVVVYSARAEQLIRPIFEAYTAETGVPVRYITDSEQPLIQKLLAEGDTTSADLLLTVDAGNLWYAAEQGALRPVDSDVLRANVPAHLRDPEDRWFGLSVRARTIVYDTRSVDPGTLTDYAGLADAQWRGRLCLRTSEKVYNQSLVAMLIAQHGEERTEQIVRGWVANLATSVFANDTQLLEAMAAGRCEIGIVNTYYLARLQSENPDLPVAVHWAPAESGGVHVNVSGAGITRHARNPEGARTLLEWLSSPAAQARFAGENLEYPANPDIEIDPLVAAWGAFEASPMNVAQAGERQAEAVRLMDRAGYR